MKYHLIIRRIQLLFVQEGLEQVDVWRDRKQDHLIILLECCIWDLKFDWKFGFQRPLGKEVDPWAFSKECSQVPRDQIRSKLGFDSTSLETHKVEFQQMYFLYVRAHQSLKDYQNQIHLPHPSSIRHSITTHFSKYQYSIFS